MHSIGAGWLIPKSKRHTTPRRLQSEAETPVPLIDLGRTAGVAELVDARHLKSLVPQGPCRFDSGPPHQLFQRPTATAHSYFGP